MKKLIVVLSCLLLLSCKTAPIVKDPQEEAIKSKYYNAELVMKDQRSSGIRVLEVKKSDNPADYTLRIYGAHEGDFYLASRKCGIMESGVYRQGEYLDYNLSQLFSSFKQSCILTVSTNPFFPKWDDSEVPISGSMAALYLRVLPDNYQYELTTNYGKSIQLSSKGTDVDMLQGPLMVVNSTPGVEIAAFNCIGGPEKPLVKTVPASGEVEFDVDELHKPGKGCLISFKDKAGGFTPFFVNIYKHDFLPLPEPQMYVSDKKLHVKGSKFVTLTDINGEQFWGSTAKADYKPGKLYIIRQYTSKGRTVVCQFKDGQGACLKR